MELRSGALFCALTRNPLASPDIIGITQGASAGEATVILVLGGGMAQRGSPGSPAWSRPSAVISSPAARNPTASSSPATGASAGHCRS